MYIRYDEILEDHGIISYVRPFPKKIWIGILISILMIAAGTLVIAHKSSTDFRLLSACFHPLEAFMNQCKKLKIFKSSCIFSKSCNLQMVAKSLNQYQSE